MVTVKRLPMSCCLINQIASVYYDTRQSKPEINTISWIHLEARDFDFFLFYFFYINSMNQLNDKNKSSKSAVIYSLLSFCLSLLL